MKKVGAILISCGVLQIVQNELLTLEVLCVGAMILIGRVLLEAGARGVL